MKTLPFSACCAVLIGATPAFAQADGPLNLLCAGQGGMAQSRPTQERVWNKEKERFDYRSRSALTLERAPMSVMVEVRDGLSRIRLPKGLIPPINSGGDDQNWWSLKDVAVTVDQIKGSYRLNGLNQPKLKIDRTTGDISIKGFQLEFQGQCDVVEPGQRRF